MEQCKDADSVARMYTIFDILNNAKEKTSVEDEYQELLTCVHKSNKEKRLASPFISRFIECFPDLIGDSYNSLLYLCEDEDVSVRKQVIKDLVTVYSKLPSQRAAIADVFAQLLATGDTGELGILNNSLLRLFNIDTEETLKGLFAGIKAYEDNSTVLDRALSFLVSKAKQMHLFTVSEEKVLLNEFKKVANLFGGDDLSKMMTIISSTKIFETNGGRQLVLDIIFEILNMNKQFDGTLEDNIDKFLQCGEQIVKVISKGDTCPGAFVLYCCTNVIPNLPDCLCHEDGKLLQLQVLKSVANATFYLKTMDKKTATRCLDAIYKPMLDHLPLPTSDENTIYNYNYEMIECYIFLLYKLCAKNTEFFEGNKERLMDFRTRLQFYARVVLGYIKAIKQELSGKREEDLKSDEMQNKTTALKLATNIYALVKDFFRTPLLCALTLGLSWLPISVVENNNQSAPKRFALLNADSQKKFRKYEVKPPSQTRTAKQEESESSARRVVSPRRFASRKDSAFKRGHGYRYGDGYSYTYRRAY